MARVYHDDKLHSENVAEGRESIRPVLKDLLSWVDKVGYDSTMADASWHREGRKQSLRNTAIRKEQTEK